MNVIIEVKKNQVREAGAVSLLYHIMRGTCSTLHSRANYVIDLLFSSSMIGAQGNIYSLNHIFFIIQYYHNTKPYILYIFEKKSVFLDKLFGIFLWCIIYLLLHCIFNFFLFCISLSVAFKVKYSCD